MQFRNPRSFTPAVVTLLVAGCGGGGGGDDGGGLAAQGLAVRNDAEGFWTGQTSQGFTVDALILEDGQTWGLYSDGGAIVGALQGTTTAPGTSLSATITDYSFVDDTAADTFFTGSVAARSSIDATSNADTRLLLSYDANTSRRHRTRSSRASTASARPGRSRSIRPGSSAGRRPRSARWPAG